MDETVEETIIGNLLRWGVILAASLVAFGGALYLIHYGKALPDYAIFRGEPSELTSLRGIVSFVASFHRRGIIQLGLIVLILTPVVRVAFLVVMFIRQRDTIYCFITVTVLAMLVYSLTGR